MSTHEVTLITRKGCHLCDDAQEAIETLRGEVDFHWTAVDVDSSADLQDTYGDRVPVILLDGREHGYWRVETDRLRAALTR
jgi:glutaredoxin